MWIHILIFAGYCVLFLCAKGFFSKSGEYLTGKIPFFIKLNSRQIRTFLLILFCGNVVGTVITVTVLLDSGSQMVSLKREENSYVEELYVTDGKHKEKVQVEVETEPYTDEEKQEMLKSAVENMEQEILGANQSLEKIEYPLNLVTEIDNTPILIQWDTDQPMMLDWEGQIGEAVPKEGVCVHLQAELILDDYREIYETDVRVYPEKISEQEQFVKDVQEQLKLQNEKEGADLYLPKEANGSELIWTKADRLQGLFLVGMAAVIGVLLILCEKSRKEQEVKKRQLEMQRDYPLILNKMILLMQAGMSSRRAIRKIALDYKSDLDQGEEKRAAFEELLRVYREMEQGVAEEETYRQLANRCDLLCYRTLSTLLIQNLKKGSSYFISALKQECTSAFEERKSQALIQGEEAGTKLLLPMGCMLLIVLVIILVPSMMVLG